MLRSMVSTDKAGFQVVHGNGFARTGVRKRILAPAAMDGPCDTRPDVTIQTAEYDGNGRRMKKTIDNYGEHDGTVVKYFYDGWRICETRDGANFMSGLACSARLTPVREIDNPFGAFLGGVELPPDAE